MASLHLYEDTLSDRAECRLEGVPARMIFVVHGSATFAGATISDGATWHGVDEAVTIQAGATGATLWRWELSRDAETTLLKGHAIRSYEKLAVELDTLPKGGLLLRGDSVAFPPGGCAYAHVHEGPGIRCLLEGGIRIDTHGRSTCYGPGGAWFEPGPIPVFAQAAPNRASRFIRVMILPQALLGKSSIRYVDPADKEKPKAQSYTIFVDLPLKLVAS